MDVSQPCIKCHVHTKYIEAQSDPDNERYVFAYMITIKISIRIRSAPFPSLVNHGWQWQTTHR